MTNCLIVLSVVFLIATAFAQPQTPYYGKLIGAFPDGAAHDVKGTVYAPTEDTIFIEGFSYDGAGPGTHFLPLALTSNANFAFRPQSSCHKRSFCTLPFQTLSSGLVQLNVPTRMGSSFPTNWAGECVHKHIVCLI